MTISASNAPALAQLSRALQTLHHSLLEHQAYQSGFTGSPLDLFDRATKDSAFGWLKPLRSMIVALDEHRGDKAPMTENDTKELINRIRDLIEVESGPLRTNLNEVFQTDPNAVWAVRTARSAMADAMPV